ncbi:glutamine-hydrolyzing carbamoyl-phosphate synthase small subunit [Psychrobacter sp. AOP22-C1-22]|uniref:glutamine-hydrolyzing carbamoyl-phosphate synthase small subunit n=1 Tax=unclassified Psychrobacter TaxID=196806 RepID=UPI0017887417|nr:MULTISPECIES: glutamine-hydrolyzing carbamoyl-phosphate synthase small subunit [unclassified Psychrobacter]MBE0406197.1 glutamine-hydrolyzing carbamoyl-phosphate synthase small subunit [Psychrobacter sp. FME6]MBE0444820.1 glutamine-hydrolyzing carbamoyl-phosphate synthase small subunit [Psychrobacter sp. FME5]MDN5801682.1 glutamine-hydrolyzing carbamoyl-phosphate synthase small subunit [Psychrobacter sp.]MDN5891593.1 glutamine-hydrolyzing carbamoyl-phosphate synthase small subunit [Psychroba
MNSSTEIQAILALADGTIFHGLSIGSLGHRVGEVVFNTAMTGYQEILTDPSYARQLVTLTYPHIGNTGTNAEDTESGNGHKVWADGLIIRDATMVTSNFRNSESLSDYLQNHNTVAIADIDTRQLTRLLRDKGAQNGCIMTASNGETISSDDEQQAIKLAQEFAGIEGMDLAKECCTPTTFEWTAGSWDLSDTLLNRDIPGSHDSGTGGFFKQLGSHVEAKYNVVAYDFGSKTNILRMLVDRGCHVTVVPAQTPIADVIKMNPDGIFLSNGPGDPAACDYAIDAVRHIIEETDIPTFGICLGHQLIGLASGANTIKMKTGHHGANHPVQDLAAGTVMITSQNHGFAVDEDTLPDNVKSTHRSLFDGTNQGIELTNKPVFSFQGHPEASPGPHDAAPLFDKFAELMAAAK